MNVGPLVPAKTGLEMPNTLVHIGVQGLALRSLTPRLDPNRYLPWILLGCVVPDAPWILQRVVKQLPAGVLPFGIDPFSLRLYCIVQASLVLCLLLSAGLAQLAPERLVVFQILAASSLLHLLLDATEIKWGNGVHLFAPVSWRLLRFDLFWPESEIVTLLTGLGLVLSLFWLARAWRKRPAAEPPSRLLTLTPERTQRLGILGVMLLLYGLLPLALLDGPARAGNHSVDAFRSRWDDGRQHASVEMYRAHYIVDDQGESALWTMDDKPLRVSGLRLPESTRVSVRGVLLDAETIRVDEWHQHAPSRDLASYAGLAIVGLAWLHAGLRRRARGEARPAASTTASRGR